jgi:hypothetical protein
MGRLDRKPVEPRGTLDEETGGIVLRADFDLCENILGHVDGGVRPMKKFEVAGAGEALETA